MLRESDFIQCAENLTAHVLHIMQVDPPRVIYVSPSYEKLWGRPLARLHQDPFDFIEGVHPEDRPLVEKSMHDQMNGRSTKVTYRVVLPDGTVRWFQDHGSPVFDDTGKVIRSTGLAADVTEQIQATMAVERSKFVVENERQNLRNLFKQTPEMVCILKGPEHLFEFTNEAHIKALGFDATGMTVRQAQPESVEVHGILDRVYQTGVSAELNEIPVTLTGRRRYFNLTYAARRDETGRIDGIMVLGIEVTEQVQARKELLNSKTRFQNLAETLPNLVWISEPGGKPVYFNQRWYEYTGLDPATQDAETWKSVMHPDDIESIVKSWESSLGSGEFYQNDQRVRRASDGQFRWHTVRAEPVKDSMGRLIEWIGTMTDIHETMTSQRDLSDVLESMSDAFFTVDADWTITHVNAKHENITRIPRETQIGRNFLQLYFPKLDLQNSKQYSYFCRAMSDRVNVRFEDYYQPLDFWGEVRIYPKSDGGLAVFFSDIGEQKRNHRRLQTVLDTVPFFAGVLDPSGIVTMANQMAADSIDSTKDQLEGQFFWDCLWWSISSDVQQQVKDAVLLAGAGKTQMFDVEYVTLKSGQKRRRWVQLTLAPVFNEVRRVESITATGFDITERVQQSKEFLVAKARAEDASRLKSAFLANMSHEIRTPLGVMMGFADLLTDSDVDDATKKQYAEILKRNGSQLNLLINDILDLSKVESGHLKIEVMEFSLRGLIEELMNELSKKARDKGLGLTFEIDEQVADKICSDPTRLRQILSNLIGNAIKFTAKGEVQLKVRDANPRIEIEVCDTGVGIAANHQPQLFRPFHQADESITRQFGGTGLGLALSKRLANLLDGDLFLRQSVVGQGSRFVLQINPSLSVVRSLQAHKTETKLPVSRSVESLRGTKILVVDDSEDTQALITQVLLNEGAIVDTANNGLEGFNKALQGDYAIVLMDVQMPVMDGYSATQRLREAGYTTPILALTAHAMSQIRRRCLDVGYTDHLPKPINLKALIDTITVHTHN